MRPIRRSTPTLAWFRARLVLHPLLFAVAPALSLMGHNLLEIHPAAGLRAVLLLLLLTILAMLLLHRWIEDKQRSAMLVSLFLLLFFSYGHVYFGLVTESTHGLFSRIGLIGNHLTLSLTWLVLFLAGIWVAMRTSARLDTLTQLMDVMAVVTVLIPLIQIVRFEVQRSHPALADSSQMLNLSLGDDEQRPDIYYLVLDGYGRADILQELYAFDNSRFIEFLEEQGFSFVKSARSNYVQTSLSVASSFNMDYLPLLIEPGLAGEDERLTLSRYIRDNRVMSLLSEQGYQTVAFATGYRPTELRRSNRFLQSASWSLNPLEGLLLETSAFTALESVGGSLGLPEYYPGYADHRQLIRFVLDTLPLTADIPGPKIVFAHIVIPHPPFVFLASGEPVIPEARFSFMDGDAFQGTEDEYLQGYRQQLQFLNSELRQVIPDLIQRSQRPMIIILQGDHGPGSQLDYQSMASSNLDERTAILLALRLPHGEKSTVPENLTPVNIFRFIFNRLDTDVLPLLPERSYYSTWNAPLEFFPIEASDLD